MAQIYKPSYTTTDPKTGKKVKKKSRTWHIRYYGPDGVRQRVKGFTDKKATETLATELERRSVRESVGLADPMEKHAKRPLDDHLADYQAYLHAKGNTADYVQLTIARIRACLDGCRFVCMTDILPSMVMAFLGELRNKGKSITTANYYLTAPRGFSCWLWKDRRIGSDPLAGMSKLANANIDVRHPRRDFTSEELRLLLT